MEQLSLAVIGLGFGQKHALNINSNNVDARLAAVCDINPKLSTFAEKVGVNFYEDYREMLKNEKLDGVIVAVPPAVHAEIGAYCMEDGKHTMVEKPIALTPEDADLLIRTSNKTGMKLLVGHQHRYDPGVMWTREKLQSGEFGQLVGFQAFSVMYKNPGYFSLEWRTKKATGGGPLLNNGIHDLDRIRYLYGEIEEVFICNSSKFRGYEVPDSIAVCFKCENGAVGTLFISDCSHPLSRFTDCCYGSEGSVMFHSPSMYSKVGKHVIQKVTYDDIRKGHDDRQRIVEEINIPEQDNHLREIQHFCRVIRGLEEPRCTGEDAKKSMEILLKLEEVSL